MADFRTSSLNSQGLTVTHRNIALRHLVVLLSVVVLENLGFVKELQKHGIYGGTTEPNANTVMKRPGFFFHVF